MRFVLTLLLATRTASFAPPSTPPVLAHLPPRRTALPATAAADVAADVAVDVAVDAAPALPRLFPSLAAPLAALGFATPTPIQAASAARALAADNLLLMAPTGSGKTLAYLLPALEKVVAGQREGGRSTVLVVAPTRELAQQLRRDATALLSRIGQGPDGEPAPAALLAIQGVDLPAPRELAAAAVLVGTPTELLAALTGVAGAAFLAGNVLSAVVLDEVDVLLPNAPKVAGGKKKGGDKKGGKKPSPQAERQRLAQKRKLFAARRGGAELSSEAKVVGPAEKLLKLVAARRSSAVAEGMGAGASPCQVLAGSATASRRTLERLNKALRDAAMDVASTVDDVWNGSVQPCRPEVAEDAEVSGMEEVGRISGDAGPATRTVTVPRQVTHRYVRLEKDQATKPGVVLTAVARAARVLKPRRALVFLCGEFKKQSTAAPQQAATGSAKPSRERKGRQKTLAQKKATATAASRARQPARGLSAAMACHGLDKLGIEAAPLHVALGLDGAAEGEAAGGDGALPPFLVTFEGAARGLHLDDVDAVFVVGRPASAASYLHLAGRVGRSSASSEGVAVIRPGCVVSICTAGGARELTKWTRQVGGTALEELALG